MQKRPSPGTHQLPHAGNTSHGRDTMKFLAKKFEHYGWTNKEGSKPALTKLIKISDYPIKRPLLAEDDSAFFVKVDGIEMERAVPLAGADGDDDEEGGPETPPDGRQHRAGRHGAAGPRHDLGGRQRTTTPSTDGGGRSGGAAAAACALGAVAGWSPRAPAGRWAAAGQEGR